MIIDGKKMAGDRTRVLRTRVLEHGAPLSLAIISIAPNFATEKYLNIKRRLAATIGISLFVYSLRDDATTEEVVEEIKKATTLHQGIVLQLPYPEHIDIEHVLHELPRRRDVDGIGTDAVSATERGDWQIVPPVVGAIADIAHEHGVVFSGKRVVVVGNGRLVGKPAALWARHEGADVVILTKESKNMQEEILLGDILILGAGVPGLITPQMIKEGVIIFDAGASEDAGRLAGDADPACVEKTSIFTPVPGGIGPLTVIKLFENLLTLSVSSVQLDHG